MAKNRLAALQEDEKKSKGQGGSLFSYIDENLLGEFGITEYKSKMEDNFLAILDPYDGEGLFWAEVKAHFNVGANKRLFLCPKSMWNEPCPICEEIEKIKADKDADSKKVKDILSNLYPKTRFLFYVVDTESSETIEEGVRYFDTPFKIKDGIVKASKHKRTGGFIDITCPDTGKDISFTKTKTGKEAYSIEYNGFCLEDRTEIQEEWLELPPFEDILKKTDYETIKDAFLGVEDIDKEREKSEKKEPATEEQKETRRSRSRRSSSEDKKEETTSRRKTREEKAPEPDPEPEQEVEETPEEEPEKPAPKKESVKEKLARLKREAAERNK